MLMNVPKMLQISGAGTVIMGKMVCVDNYCAICYTTVVQCVVKSPDT